MRRNYLICWIEKAEKKWDMVKETDFNDYGMKLLCNKDVDAHSIFIIPTSGFIQGIWLQPENHKSRSVDFWNFHEDLGIKYEKPKLDKDQQKIVDEINEKTSENTKYGWISPEGRYFHCGYQGHIALADRICFGMTDTNNAERYLEEKGWCKIYKPLLEEQYSVYVGEKHVITDAQMKTLIGLGLENAKHLSEMLCKDK